jgi:hypothetical protein
VAWGEVLARAEPILCVASCHGEADVLREIHGGLIERAARRGCPLCGGGGGESGFEMGWSRNRGGGGSRTTTHHSKVASRSHGEAATMGGDDAWWGVGLRESERKTSERRGKRV